MRRVRSADTGLELRIRSLLHALGYRFRLGIPLPGKPDIVFPGRHKVIFCHGCFWHSHEGCKRGSVPNSRKDFWIPKLLRNKQRDQEIEAELRALGWDVLIVWECELKDMVTVQEKLTAFLPVSIKIPKRSGAAAGS